MNDDSGFGDEDFMEQSELDLEKGTAEDFVEIELTSDNSDTKTRALDKFVEFCLSTASYIEEHFDNNVVLLNHIRCASHTLNLVATVDFNKILGSDTKLKKIFDGSLERAEAYWKKVNQSTLAADKSFDLLGNFNLKPFSFFSTNSLLSVFRSPFKISLSYALELTI